MTVGGASNPPTSVETSEILDNGISKLLEQDFDSGIKAIDDAYARQKNDETRMYYALSQIAQVSIDENVTKIVKENLGFKEYPATLNALFTSEWLKKYSGQEYVSVYKIEEDENGSCVRVSVDSNAEDYFYPRAYLDDAGDWISSYDSVQGKYVLNADGKYLVSYWDLTNEERASNPTRYNYTFDHSKHVLSDSYSSLAPDFNLPDWVKNSDLYKNSIVDTVETVSTIGVKMFGALIECNPNGLNELVDNVLKVFESKKLSNAKSVISEMSNASVALPEKVIKAFNLESVLGENISVKVGKAELNVLLAALNIYKGTFQLISSYDLSADTDVLKDLFTGSSSSYEKFGNAFNLKTFAVRNADAVKASKETFISAIDTLLESYDAMFGTSSTYPQGAVDTVKEYGDFFVLGAKELKNALNNDSVFYIPKDFGGTRWTTSAADAMFGIDLGKAFTAGYFSEIVEKDSSGDAVLYGQTDYCFQDSSYNETERKSIIQLTTTIDEFMESESEALKTELEKTDYRSVNYTISVGFSMNLKLVKDMLPGLMDSANDMEILPFMGAGGQITSSKN